MIMYVIRQDRVMSGAARRPRHRLGRTSLSGALIWSEPSFIIVDIREVVNMFLAFAGRRWDNATLEINRLRSDREGQTW